MLIKERLIRPFVFQKALFFICTILFFVIVLSNGMALASDGHALCSIESIQNKQKSYKKNKDKYNEYGALIDKTETKIKSVPLNNIEFKISQTTPHDIKAFTQGLIYYQNFLYESIGGLGFSEIRKVSIKTGKIIKSSKLPVHYFAEGLERINNKIIQLTLKKNIALVYDINNFNMRGKFEFSGNGWGLVKVDNDLLISDGSSTLKRINNKTYDPLPLSNVKVTVKGQDLDGINEMEYINGMIYANIWPTDCIAIIDPKKYRVAAWIDLSRLYPEDKRLNPNAVINGIAHDSLNDTLLVTGKYWPHIFHLKLKKYPSRL